MKNESSLELFIGKLTTTTLKNVSALDGLRTYWYYWT